MQRKGNAIRSESQVKNQISVGIDMGGNSRSGLGSGKNELLRSERQG